MNETDPSVEFHPPFLCAEPDRQRFPFVFNAPHAGSVYPASFLSGSHLDAVALRRSEDAFVDRLFAPVVRLGAPLISARFPRAYLDVNREPYELDPRMFDGKLPPYANTRSMRVAGGLGTIPRIVADGHDIYRGRLPVAEALRRIELLYKPYHRLLRTRLARTVELFGQVVLIDCHSMPSTSLNREDLVRADVVLGDRYGTSCAGLLTDLVDAALRERGYAVVRNKPYAGGFITEHYGAPALGRHSLQIEINRALYMDERTLQPGAGFGRLTEDLTDCFADVMMEVGGGLEPTRIAAE
ncbi:N-formylglutamate amidohydrolase [Enterovirga aerilata]|uniref:N-formylglutamate amidohydrolase n=1 Tax=Enterovirga aerilata TaxID=2730920 RepID=A0A849IDL3_9HYPH|nr:N-formylglutamate amidohydrolase [Enterovirga sp. DB1703]NNM74305.1 N-formylglutamate amidohydrolase [Enterovirga sp. DB1703]